MPQKVTKAAPAAATAIPVVRMKHFTTQFEIIYPDIAEKYLAKSAGNRPIRLTNIQRIIAAIINMFWIGGPPGIVFNEDGVLVDGHHRLLAVIQSGRAVEMPVYRDVDRRWYATADTGASRSPADILSIVGVKSPTAIAAVARLSINIERKSNLKATHPNADIQAWCANNAPASHIVDQCRGLKGVINPNAFAAVLYNASKSGAPGIYDKIGAFIEGVKTGENLASGDPRLILKNWASEASRRNKLRAEETVFAIITAWNAFVKDEALSKASMYRAADSSVFNPVPDILPVPAATTAAATKTPLKAVA